MCPSPVEDKSATSSAPAPAKQTDFMGILTAVIAVIVVVELASIIGLEANKSSSEPATIVINNGGGVGVAAPTEEEGEDAVTFEEFPGFLAGENVCAGQNPLNPNVACIVDATENVGPQAGANVTKGYKGKMEVDHEPIMTPYWQNSMCPVNVHWHLGTEHYSVGEFDEFGNGPNGNAVGLESQADGAVQAGYRCRHYDPEDSKFTKPYDWKHCILMEVGETYEVHWPHSAAGACGTPNQYQTPFYDGVFCMDGVLTDSAKQVGVQAQIFTIVNDDTYYYPDLMRGMIVDGEMGVDMHKYTGSTTGSARNNDICSPYTPITWQVDRKCHLISASSFDKLCYDMKLQRDDMTNDLYPHGSRELVSDNLAANNGVRQLVNKKKNSRKLRASA